MKRVLAASCIAVALIGFSQQTTTQGIRPVSVAGAATASPSIQVHAIYNAYVILSVTGTGFAPNSPLNINVTSSLLTFDVNGASITSDASGSMSFGPDEIVSACSFGRQKGTVTVTDGVGNKASANWSVVCKPMH